MIKLFMNRKNWNMLLLCLTVPLVFTACGGGGGGGGSDSTVSNPDSPATLTGTIKGTAATGAPLSNAAITLKGANGVTKTVTTGAFGGYSTTASGLTAPVLIKVFRNSTTIYGIAPTTGTANVHQFTDLIIKNWYKVKGTAVEAVFNSNGAIQVPTTTEINTIEATVKQIIATWLQSIGLARTTLTSLQLRLMPMEMALTRYLIL